MARESKDHAEELIGKSYGCEIDFEIEGSEKQFIRCYTTRPDTLLIFI